jgi:hypothetical protein
MLENLEFDKNFDSKKNLFTVVQKTYDGFEKLIDDSGKLNNFLECISKITLSNTTSTNYKILFIGAVKETLKTRDLVFESINNISLEKLSNVGLIEDPLRLKVQLFREKLFKLSQLIGNFADFRNNKLVNAFLDELKDLLNILQSLGIVIPPLEPLIELIKALMSLLRQL